MYLRIFYCYLKPISMHHNACADIFCTHNVKSNPFQWNTQSQGVFCQHKNECGAKQNKIKNDKKIYVPHDMNPVFDIHISYHHLVSHPWAKYLMCFHFYAFSNISCRVSIVRGFFSSSFFHLTSFPFCVCSSNFVDPVFTFVTCKTSAPIIMNMVVLSQNLSFTRSLFYLFRSTNCPHFNTIQMQYNITK